MVDNFDPNSFNAFMSFPQLDPRNIIECLRKLLVFVYGLW